MTRSALIRRCTIWFGVVVAFAVAQWLAARWLATWDAGAHILRGLRGGAQDVVPIVGVFALRAAAYFVVPFVATWSVARAIVRAADDR